MVKSKFFTHLIETGQFRIDEDGHAYLLNEFFFLLPPSILLKLQEILERELGYKKMKKIIMELGIFQTQMAIKRYIKIYNIVKINKGKIINFGLNILKILGFGKIEIKKISYDKKIIELIIKSSTLPLEYKKMYKKKSKKPIDFFVCGLIKGSFSSIFEEEIEVKETKCIAMGDPYCEFIGKPKTKG